MLLAVVMLTTAMIAAVPPITANAASSAPADTSNLAPNMYIGDDEENFKTIAKFKNQLDYSSAAEMLATELAANQLVYANSLDGNYAVYVNVYTGFMYYLNRITGQVLMSNDYNYKETTGVVSEMLSQVIVEYYPVTSTPETSKQLDSYRDSAIRNQIQVTKLTNGLRVNYTLGDTTLRYLVPGAISSQRFYNNIVTPILKVYLEEVIKGVAANDAKRKPIYNPTSSSTDPYKNANEFFYDYLTYYKALGETYKGQTDLFYFAAYVMEKDATSPQKANSDFVKSGAVEYFNEAIPNLYSLFNIDREMYFCNTHKRLGVHNEQTDEHRCPECNAVLEKKTCADYLFFDKAGELNLNSLNKYVMLVSKIVTEFFTMPDPMKPSTNIAMVNPLQEEVFAPLLNLVNYYKKADDGDYLLCTIKPGVEDHQFEATEKLIETYCLFIENPTYTFNDMFRDEKEWNYVHQFASKEVFRCALEYTFNEDGSLCVTLPANSIAFDESSFVLKSITTLKYFGSGSLLVSDENGHKSGYVFYPDGSGAIINYADFLTRPLVSHAQIYGIDHAYSDIYSITGDYREQVTLPVYGMVYTENVTDPETLAATGATTLNNGFFAVIEEGAALATLWTEFKSTSCKLAIVYPQYKPYPADTYDLSQTLSVSGLSSYTMVSESKYNGSYKTRITMLADEKLNSAYGYGNFDASYVGMAECYRNLLKSTGAISAISALGNDLPLYIEAFGSMEVTEKILSFPVEVSMELTTFDDIRTMYDQFADAKKVLHDKATEYQNKANAEVKDLSIKALYQQKANDYLALEAKIQNITNINFRLTGFANGGMEYTYPSKVKWDSVVGGKDGFNALLNYSEEVAGRSNSTLGIYPDFDFLYISNTSLFDGVSTSKVAAKLIDNRYAAKQLYNSVTHTYESFLTKIVSADALAELYTKFNEDFSEFNIKTISVATLGSDVNSNFDDENPINRDDATAYISDLLKSMRDDGYSMMVNKGNAYSIEYASHIIDAYIDSSHLTTASYTIPFYGMVLHGYVNYTGNALNYSGDPSYEVLRSIESGASLYYILCYQNTEKLKENLELNKYYGVSYINWFDKIVEQYATINAAIGALQNYEIVDHKILRAERVIDADERKTAYNLLVSELIENVKTQIVSDVSAAFAEMTANGEFGKGVKVTIDNAAVIEEAKTLLNLVNNKQVPEEFAEKVYLEIDSYLNVLEEELCDVYMIAGAEPGREVVFDHVEKYESKHNYITDSYSTDGVKYVETQYTLDNYNVVMVTYRDPKNGHEVKFVLNFNIYSVIVNIEGEDAFVLGKYEFKTLN